MAQPLKFILRRQLFNISLALAAMSIATIVWSTGKLYQAHDYNRHLTANTLSQQDSPDALLLNATIYERRGQNNKALTTYALLAAEGDDYFARAAYFNSGNIYLKQATETLERETLMGWDNAGPLLALAKSSYQRALNIDPSWSEAKYNFELALRLSPANHGRKGPSEYERDEEQIDERPSGWPSIPGSPRGMP
ncbi:MAG: hypothetical protein WC696_08555 [Candidatus Methylopumilus sp.]|jgi:mxaK protein